MIVINNKLKKLAYDNILEPSPLYTQTDAKKLILEQIRHYAIWSGQKKLLNEVFIIDEFINKDKQKVVTYYANKGGLKVTDTYGIVRESRKIEGQINVLFSNKVTEIQVNTRLGVVAIPDIYFKVIMILQQEKDSLHFCINDKKYIVQRNADSRLSLYLI